MSARAAPAAGAGAGASPAASFTPAWLARRLAQLGLPARGARACVAYSGGADSTALLAALAVLRPRLRLQLRALHVDHALVPGSAARARAARRRALALGVPCTVLRRPVRPARGESPEAAARATRYAALRTALAPGEWLLLAHHADDQLETVLLQLLRGAGPAGLAASPERAGQELRPLLPLGRAALRAWLEAEGLGWTEDPSNRDPRHARNYLRHEVLPRLLARWPSAAASVGRSARLAAEAAGLLQARADVLLDQAREGRALRASDLRALGPQERRNLLRRWLQWCGVPAPDERALRELAGPVLAARADAHPEVRWPGALAWRSDGRLHARADERRGLAAWPRAGLAWDWRAAPVLALPGGGQLELRPDGHGPVDARSLPPTLRVRPRQGGERYGARGGSRRLKELLRTRGVPARERAGLPLVYGRGRLLAAGGEWLAARGGRGADVKRGARARLRLLWRPPI